MNSQELPDTFYCLRELLSNVWEMSKWHDNVFILAGTLSGRHLPYVSETLGTGSSGTLKPLINESGQQEWDMVSNSDCIEAPVVLIA